MGIHKYTYYHLSISDLKLEYKIDKKRALRYFLYYLMPKSLKGISKTIVERIMKKVSIHDNGDILIAYYGRYGRKEIFKREWFDGFEVLSYEGRKIRVPVKTHEYLSHLYGDYMNPPAIIPESTHSQYYVNLKEHVALSEVYKRVLNGITREY